MKLIKNQITLKNRIFFLLFIIACTIQNSTAQFGIGTNTPDPSSVLDISSSDKGILIPRMIEENRDGISEPAKGLLIYNLTTDTIQVNAGTPLLPDWINVIGITGASSIYNISAVEFGLVNHADGGNSTAIGGTYNIALLTNSTATGGTYVFVNGINAANVGGSTNTSSGENSVGIGGTINISSKINALCIGGTVNEANGDNSSVTGGTTSDASGNNSSIIGGSTSLAPGLNAAVGGGAVNLAEGNQSGVIAGSVNKARNTDTVVLGGAVNTASGINASVAGGTVNTASALNAVVLGGTSNKSFGSNAGILAGTTNNASGLNSILIGGSSSTAIGENTIITGGGVNFAYGNSSTVSGGYGNQSKSYGEWIGGINTTDYSGSVTEFVLTDRLFNIGNGAEAGSRNDAFTIYKNGLAVSPNTTADMITLASQNAITNKEFLAVNYSKFSTIAPISSIDATGVIGEIRMTESYIYLCYAASAWARFPVSNW